MGEKRLYNLDGLRGVAAFAVLLGHSAHLIGWRDLLPRFYLAVDFFFLLSGYIMARTYQERLAAGRWSEFLWRRFVRLWPLLVTGTGIGLLIALYLGETNGLGVRLLLGVACIPAIIPVGLFPLDGPQWSLFFEVCANLVHVAFRRGVSTKLVYLPPLVFGLGIAALAMNGKSLNGGFDASTIWMGFLRVGFSYSAGIALWRLRLPEVRTPFPVVAAAILVPMAAPLNWSVGLDAITILLIWPAILLLARADPQRHAYATAMLGGLGALSYPLYIVHYPLIRATAHIEHAFQLGSRVSMVIGFAGSAIIAAACLHLVDGPARRVLQKRRTFPRFRAAWTV